MIDNIFNPKSIAVIGASEDISKIGGFIFSQIKTQKKILSYPVNGKSQFIQKEKAYSNIGQINKKIDLAIIAIPRNLVINAVEDCIKAAIKNIIIITAGFKETDEKGKEIELKLKELISKNKINLIGPNCLGILNPLINLNCSFAKECPKAGNIALISQSGAIIDAVIDWSFRYDIGFSKIASLGNMAGVDFYDMVNYLKNDKKTSAIAIYMETLENGEKFAKILKEISKKKPIIIIKPGNTQKAKIAISSHTGSLAQDNLLVKTIFEENNVIHANSLNQFFNILKTINVNYPKTSNMTIVTNAGGPGVIATDEISKTSLELYKFSLKEKERFDFLPQAASINNPIDILGDAKSDRYEKTIKELEKINDIGIIAILLTPQIMTDCEDIAKSIAIINKKSKKTIVTCFLGNKEVKRAINHLNQNNVANFETPEDMINTLDLLYKYENFKYDEKLDKNRFDMKKIEKINKSLLSKKGLLDFETTKKVLDCLDIKIHPKAIFKSINDIFDARLNPHKKYILKVDSSQLIHKIDAGGVIKAITNINFEDKVREAFSKMSKITNDFSITLEEEIEGFEVITGLKSDEELGNFIFFGMGGTYVDIYDDKNLSVCPLNKFSALRLVKKSKAFKALNGFRGTKKINFQKLYDILIKISYLQIYFPQIKEVDLNPLICSDEEIHLVDVKLII